MKKIILALVVMFGLSSIAIATTCNKMINKQYEENLKITDIYITIENAHILGFVVGVQVETQLECFFC